MTDGHDPLTEAITAAMHRSVQTARSVHKALGLPVAVWRDERVQLLDPATLEPVAWPPGVREDEPPPLSPRS